MILEGFLMKKESISYEIMIDLIANIVKKHTENSKQVTEDGDSECLKVG